MIKLLERLWTMSMAATFITLMAYAMFFSHDPYCMFWMIIFLVELFLTVLYSLLFKYPNNKDQPKT